MLRLRWGITATLSHWFLRHQDYAVTDILCAEILLHLFPVTTTVQTRLMRSGIKHRQAIAVRIEVIGIQKQLETEFVIGLQAVLFGLG